MRVVKQRALGRSSRHRLFASIIVLAVTPWSGSSLVEIGNTRTSLYCTATEYPYSDCPSETIVDIPIVVPVRIARYTTVCPLLPYPTTPHLSRGMP